MAKRLILYRDQPRAGQSFKKSQKFVVPNQSMTLQEIIRRFVKREPLPQMKDGSYHEGEYDLEKLAKEDRVVRDEVLEEVKRDVEVKKVRAKKAVESSRQVDPKEVVSPKPPGENP